MSERGWTVTRDLLAAALDNLPDAHRLCAADAGFVWRTGRHVGRTIYAQYGPEPSDEDQLIGVMDSPALAAEACEGRNLTAEAVQELAAEAAIDLNPCSRCNGSGSEPAEHARPGAESHQETTAGAGPVPGNPGTALTALADQGDAR